MSASHTTRGHDRHIHICQFDLRFIFREEDVGTLDISVQNIHIMKDRKTLECLVGNLPYGAFVDIFPRSFVLFDQLKDITSFEVLCHNAESVGELVIERIFVAENTGVIDAGQNSNLIETVSQLFFVESRNANLFHSILEPIFFAFDLVNH